MDVFVENIGKVNLSENKDFKTQGGEGKIYIKGDVVYKIYLDPTKAIKREKIKELSVLELKNIIKPENIIWSNQRKDKMIGYTMRFVKNTEPLCKYFTNSFLNTNNINSKDTLELVLRLQETIRYIHSRKILLVDGNEFNYLVSNKGRIPYFIDVDSYQTPSFPATAIMPSIRDWHTKGFNEMSDWFSFAIIACQLFIGIHPFKGTHSKFSKKDLEGRMKANVSIFNKNVSIPATVRDFNNIPDAFMEWFTELFEKGKRILPPGVVPIVLKTIQPKYDTIKGSNNFEIALLYKFAKNIQDVLYSNGRVITYTLDKTYFDKHESVLPKGYDINFTTGDCPIGLKVTDNKLDVFCDVKPVSSLGLKIDKLATIDGIPLAIAEDKVSILKFIEQKDSILPVVEMSFSILPKATEIYNNLMISNVLGLYHLIIVSRQGGKLKYIPVPIKELKDYKIVDAKRERNVVIIIGFNKGKYEELMIKFNDNFSNYSFSVLDDDMDTPEINFIALENNVCLLINEDGYLNLFTSNWQDNNIQKIQDKTINTNMKLVNIGRAALYQNETLYTFNRKQ